MSIITKNKTSQ